MSLRHNFEMLECYKHFFQNLIGMKYSYPNNILLHECAGDDLVQKLNVIVYLLLLYTFFMCIINWTIDIPYKYSHF